MHVCQAHVALAVLVSPLV